MIVDILTKIRPGAQWSLRGDTLVWLDEIQTEPTAEEIEAGRLLVEADDANYKAKTEGELYPGTNYKVSFVTEDANAIMQVKAAFEMGLSTTNIKFSNGTVMPIQATEFTDFAIWFVTKRNSFFI